MRTIGRRFIVEVIEEPKSESSIILLSKTEKQNLGKVIFSPDESLCKIGDVVQFEKFIVRDIGNYKLLEDFEILAVYPNGDMSVENMVIPANYVLVEITHDTSVIDLAGQDFYLDTRFEKYKYAPTYGVVRKLPNELICHSEEIKNAEGSKKQILMGRSIPHKTEMELEIGDKVHFDYLSSFVANEKELTHKGFIFIHYHHIFAKEDELGDLMLVNGYLAVDIEKDEKSAKIGSIELINVDLRDNDKRKKWGLGKIVYLGNPNKGYALNDIDETMVDVSIGDTIMFQDTKRSKFGEDIYLKAEKLKGLYKIQRKDIHAKLSANV